MNLFDLVTSKETIQWLSRNMLPNINTCENGCLNFSGNLRLVTLKVLKLSQFTCPNLSIYCNSICAILHGGIIKRTCFQWGDLLSFHHGVTRGHGWIGSTSYLCSMSFICLPCAYFFFSFNSSFTWILMFSYVFQSNLFQHKIQIQLKSPFFSQCCWCMFASHLIV